MSAPGDTPEGRDEPGAQRREPDAPDEADEPVDRNGLRRSRRRRRAAQDAADDPVPQLPRPKFFRRLAMLDVFRIAMLAALLVAVIVLRKPCADAASNFVSSFDVPPDAAPAADPLEGYELVPAEELLERLRDGGTAADLEAAPAAAEDTPATPKATPVAPKAAPPEGAPAQTDAP